MKIERMNMKKIEMKMKTEIIKKKKEMMNMKKIEIKMKTEIIKKIEEDRDDEDS